LALIHLGTDQIQRVERPPTLTMMSHSEEICCKH